MDASLKRMMMDEDVYNSYEFKQQLLAAVSPPPPRRSLRITFQKRFKNERARERERDYFSRSYCGTIVVVN